MSQHDLARVDAILYHIKAADRDDLYRSLDFAEMSGCKESIEKARAKIDEAEQMRQALRSFALNGTWPAVEVKPK